MLQLILIRPGSTDYDHQCRIQGTLDIPLSDAGKQEAAEIAEKLRAYLPKALYCTPCASAEETAKLIGIALELKAKPLDRLQNMNLGLWQGMRVEEVRHKQPKVYKQWQEHPETVRPPEGEMLAEAVERADEVLEKLARKHRTGAIAVVAPEPLASIMLQRIEGKQLADLWRAANGCNRVDVLTLQPSFAKVAIQAADNKNSKGAAGEKKANGVATIVYRGTIVEHR